jgi:hypothetical protein
MPGRYYATPVVPRLGAFPERRPSPPRRLAVAWCLLPGRPGALRCASCGGWVGAFPVGHGAGLAWCERHAVQLDAQRGAMGVPPCR